MNNLFLIVIFFGLAGVFLYLQYKLCSAENGKKLGLILPIISFLISVLCAVSVFLFTGVTSTEDVESYDEYGNYVETEVVEFEETYDGGLIPSVIAVFIITNIPTLLFMIEYAVVTSERKKTRIEADEIEKTQIQDL